MFMASEQHLWGPRDYFKSDFYKNTKASFVSEIGYHGCPAVERIKKFISQDKNYEEIGNIEWDYHASNPFMQDNDFLNYRTKLMIKQIRELFGTVPEKLEDFVEASQICQAEAKKFFLSCFKSFIKEVSFSLLLFIIQPDTAKSIKNADIIPCKDLIILLLNKISRPNTLIKFFSTSAVIYHLYIKNQI